MTPHTPGPWRVAGQTDILALEGTPAVIVVASTQFFAGVPTDQQIADARLIAAAPDMFAALCELIDDEACKLDHHGYCQAHSLGKPCGVGLGREALARAKGQKS